jgi:Membrane bound beta barrel domain (DUF5777)
MRNILVLFIMIGSSTLFAQDDLLKELEQRQAPETNYIGQTFKGTRIINSQSVETKGKGELEFIFSHRFGKINEGSFNLWGLDQAYVRIGFEYGITDRLGLGIGRSSTDKTYDSYLRYKVARQSTGAKSFPVTITAIGTTNVKTSLTDELIAGIKFDDKVSYVAQLLIARKFSTKLSAQIMPVFVHRNAVKKSTENNDDYAIGIAARYKITRSLALTGEYFHRLNPNVNTPYYNSLGFGLEIETGGHVFQMVFSNSQGMIDRAVVAETDGDFAKGDIHFGFNVTRVFQMKKH